MSLKREPSLYKLLHAVGLTCEASRSSACMRSSLGAASVPAVSGVAKTRPCGSPRRRSRSPCVEALTQACMRSRPNVPAAPK